MLCKRSASFTRITRTSRDMAKSIFAFDLADLNRVLVPLLPRYARDLHLNPMQVGLLFGSYAVALLLATTMTLLGNFLADLAYAALDPRLTFGSHPS